MNDGNTTKTWKQWCTVINERTAIASLVFFVLHLCFFVVPFFHFFSPLSWFWLVHSSFHERPCFWIYGRDGRGRARKFSITTHVELFELLYTVSRLFSNWLPISPWYIPWPRNQKKWSTFWNLESLEKNKLISVHISLACSQTKYQECSRLRHPSPTEIYEQNSTVTIISLYRTIELDIFR